MSKTQFHCSGCQQPVMKYLSQLTRVDIVFCTLTCRNKNYKKVCPDWHPNNYIGPIAKECKTCHIVFHVVPRDSGHNRQFCSKKCARKDQSRHPHSEETKAILSHKQSEYIKVHGNQFSGLSHSLETKSLLSKKNSGKDPRWKGRTFQYNGPNGCFKMRSSYELFYAKWMDNQGIGWKYEPQFKLSNGKTFSPDFQLSTNVIIEVKGYWAKVGLEKWTMFCADYPLISKKVLMRDDLVSLGMEI